MTKYSWLNWAGPQRAKQTALVVKIISLVYLGHRMLTILVSLEEGGEV